MAPGAQRDRLRRLLASSGCVSPASVHDALSARLAEEAGFDLGVLSGSVTACVLLAAPDLMLHTLSELAELARRITRVSELALIVDADNGFGNALQAMRTVRELEHAGVAALSIEDSVGPGFTPTEGSAGDLVSIAEAVGKYRAAVAARTDPSLVIAARSRALQVEGIDRAVQRARAYAAAGVDAIWLPRIDRAEEVVAIGEAVRLPVVVGTRHSGLTRQLLADSGVRIALQGHLPLAAAVKAMQETYAHLVSGGAPGQLQPKVASGQEIDRLLGAADYEERRQAYMRASGATG